MGTKTKNSLPLPISREWGAGSNQWRIVGLDVHPVNFEHTNSLPGRNTAMSLRRTVKLELGA